VPYVTAAGFAQVMTGVAFVTVNVAGSVVTVPRMFVNTARYCLPESAILTMNAHVVKLAPLRFVHVHPPSVLTCHCTVGVGVPLAAAVKPAVPSAAPV
jgi:hypothetical protein